MDIFKIFVLIFLMIGIVLNVAQFVDFKEWRSQVIDAIYLAITFAVIFSTDFLEFL